MRDTGTCPCESAEELLRRHLEEIDAEMAQLPTDREEVSRMGEELVLPRSCCDDADCPPDCGDDCC